MRRPIRIVLACATTALVVGCWGATTWPLAKGQPAPRDGQIQFIPWAEVDVGGSATSAANALEIRACVAGKEGMLVEGRVDRMGVITAILVTGGDPTSAGIRAGFAEPPVGSYPGAVPGVFSLNIPWADRDSLFALLDPNGGSAGTLIDVETCPRR